jgi:hypothetical protein
MEKRPNPVIEYKSAITKETSASLAFFYIDIFFYSGKILTLYTVILSGLFFAQNYPH